MRTGALIVLLAATGWLGFSLGGCGVEAADEGTAAANATTPASNASGGTVEACAANNAEDHTGEAEVTITFAGLTYGTPCLKVSAGTKVIFSGAFASHPLRGGSDGNVDSSSPIPSVDGGDTSEVTLADAGKFPYYCDFHVAQGMSGTIFVE